MYRHIELMHTPKELFLSPAELYTCSIARCFSSRAVTYTSEAYCQVLSPLYRILVRRAGMSRNWEVAVHWLQELLNHDVRVHMQYH